MKAALKTPAGTFKIREVELPGAEWVMVRVKGAGICGTDLRHRKMHEGDLVGHIMGHELAGEAVAIGDEVDDVLAGAGASFASWELGKEQGQVIELLGKGRLDAERLVIHRCPLERINEAFACAQSKQESGTVFIAAQMD